MNTAILHNARNCNDGWYLVVDHRHGLTYGVALRRAVAPTVKAITQHGIRPKVVRKAKRKIRQWLSTIGGAVAGFGSAALIVAMLGGGA